MSRWYLYENEEVKGPFEQQELRGRIGPESLLCRAGEEEWNPAESLPDLKDFFTDDPSPEKKTPPSDPASQTAKTGTESTGDDSVEPIEPTLENLRDLCEKASDRNLRYEYDDHSEEYDAEELELIRSELERRNLLSEF